ncbi:I78 family peptidase inhibitor [Frigidibacter sp. MR17.24]|uniref:I78 family peptidase inhibitor n=1 Tax=Frigidibacter sp. MR17.24 TaxID=3127345 RepID=UPI003012AC66
MTIRCTAPQWPASRSPAPRCLAALPVALLLLAGCQTARPEPAADAPAAPGAADSCGAAAHQGLVGRERAAVERTRFATPPRVITPGSMVTMDYAPERLNIGISEAGLVERVYCG